MASCIGCIDGMPYDDIPVLYDKCYHTKSYDNSSITLCVYNHIDNTCFKIGYHSSKKIITFNDIQHKIPIDVHKNMDTLRNKVSGLNIKNINTIVWYISEHNTIHVMNEHEKEAPYFLHTCHTLCIEIK